MELKDYISTILQEIPDNQEVELEVSIYPDFLGKIQVTSSTMTDVGNKIRFKVSKKK